MHVSALRHVLAVVATGSGLLLGGASLPHLVAQYPALLYAAGEVHMLLGDTRGGVNLIGRAEAARRNADRGVQPLPETTPQTKPVEICTRIKTTSVEHAKPQASPVNVAVDVRVPPKPPTPPGFDSYKVAFSGPGVSSFKSFGGVGRQWQQVKIARVQMAKAVRAARAAESKRILIAAKQNLGNHPENVAMIMEGVQRDLERSGVSVPSDFGVASDFGTDQ